MVLLLSIQKAEPAEMTRDRRFCHGDETER